MKQEFGKVLWIAGALIVSLAFSVVVSSWIGFTNEEALDNFRRGIVVMAALGAFLILFREKIRSPRLLEKFLLYVLVPLSGLTAVVYGLVQEFAPHLLAQ